MLIDYMHTLCDLSTGLFRGGSWPNQPVGIGSGAGNDYVRLGTESTSASINSPIITTEDGESRTDKNMMPYICMNYIIRAL